MRARPELLKRYLLAPAAEERFPPDWDLVFGRQAERIVELGFGNGEYLAFAARERAECDFIGIEEPQQCLIRGTAALAAAEVSNVRLVQGDGRYLLRELFAPSSVRAVLVQFPMPWPKVRHAKHRVIGAHLAATLADVMVVGGEFELVTDQDWFALAARADLLAHGSFQVMALEQPRDRSFHTRYERRWLELGRPVWRLRAHLARSVPAERLCEDRGMHAIRLPTAPAYERVLGLSGRRFTASGVVGEIKEVWTGTGGWLLSVVSADESFTQFYFLRLAQRPDGKAVLQVAEQPRPYPTRAVRFLLEAVGAALSG